MADISTLHDDFEDGVIDATLWSTSGTVAETGGRLVITPTSSGVASYAISRSLYDLSNSQVTAQIPVATAVGITHSVQCALAVSIDNDHTIALRKIGATLYASTIVSGTTTDNPLATYDATAHLYWRIRADSSNIYWETSATGVSPFFIQYTQNTSSLFDITSLYVWLFTVYTGVEPATGSFRIEEINPGQKLTFSGASLSAGQLRIIQVRTLTFSGASSSAGSLSVTIPPLTANQLTGTAVSVSTGSLALIKLAPSSTSLLFAGSSTSSGSLTLMKTGTLSFFGQSFSTAHLTLTVVAPSIDPALVQYFIFEPPVVYDRPGIHAYTPRRIRREMYYYAHSPGPTGQSVLKLDGKYQTIYTPTTDQISQATKVYQGGHIYTIPQQDADELVAAGYSVTPIPLPTPLITVYPLDTLYPDEDLFPGYHDLELVSP